MRKSLLVSGASGFLGSVVVRQAVNAGLSLSATDRTVSAKFKGVNFIPADILDPLSLSKAFQGVDCVCHVAGLAHIFDKTKADKAPFMEINEIGTANMASAAAQAGAKHFILISSVSVYGPFTKGVYAEDVQCNPTGPYAVSKYNAEQRAQEIAKKSGMVLTILRLATLYGEGDPGNVGRLIRMLDRGRFLWIGSGNNLKSLLYKGDAARACLAVAERPASGISIYNVSGPACTMREIVGGIAKALGKHPLPGRVPASLALFLSRNLSGIPNRCLAGLHQTVEKWLADDVYDTRRFEETYGFQTKTSLEEGLKREVDWYRQNKEIN